MSKSRFFLIALILFGLTRVFAQNGAPAGAGWVRAESAKKDFSVVFPKDRLVFVDESNGGARTSFYGFADGVALELTIRKQRQSDARANLGRIPLEEARRPAAFDFEAGGFYGKSVIYAQGGYENTIFLAGRNAYYVLRLAADSKDRPAIARVLASLRLGGAPLFDDKTAAADAALETVALEDAETSAEVAAALKRKTPKTERLVRFEPLAAYAAAPVDYALRPAIALAGIFPAMNAGFLGITQSGDVRVAVRLLADGRVGDITVYSDLDRAVLRAYAESAAKLKFIPARRADGAPADSTQVFWSRFGVTTGTFTIFG